jgi:hypothetical protein
MTKGATPMRTLGYCEKWEQLILTTIFVKMERITRGIKLLDLFIFN